MTFRILYVSRHFFPSQAECLDTRTISFHVAVVAGNMRERRFGEISPDDDSDFVNQFHDRFESSSVSAPSEWSYACEAEGSFGRNRTDRYSSVTVVSHC